MKELDIIREHIESHPQGGRFLDIGAFDGTTDSLTKPLREAGWHGVLVEPKPSNFLNLRKQCGDNPRMCLVNSAVMPTSRMLKFWQEPTGGQLSSASESHVRAFRDAVGTQFTAEHIMAVGVVELMDYFGGPENWDFVNIDAEGLSVQIFEAMPLERMNSTELIIIEHDRKAEKCIRIGEHNGFNAEIIGINVVLRRAS